MGVRRNVPGLRPILREGDLESHAVVLHNAVCKVTAAMADGRQALLAIRVTGDVVGETSALNHTPRSATVTTCRPSTVAVIREVDFRSFLKQHPDAAVEMAGMTAGRLRWANRRRVDFASYPVKVRLARVIADIAETYGYDSPSGTEIGVRLTQLELATLCGAAEVSVQKALRELRSEKAVSTAQRRVVVSDMATLRSMAELDGVSGAIDECR
ncbi:MAG TPA: Crp/Fnr family transcriptional regulator [Pilimelia sp.]|nr:Crp/Fnr family transcriptional regulator [Pilimelia sp.]